MSDETITNRNSDYLRAHADIEHEAMAPTTSDAPSSAACLVHPLMTGVQIEKIIRNLSTDTHDVIAEIVSINEKPVVTLKRIMRPTGLDALLRYGNDEPLSYLERKQDS